MDWGVLLDAVGDVALPFQTDDVNMIQVFMRQGSLSSVTELEMLKGKNQAALLTANGAIELVNFRDATPAPDVPGRYTLSRLLRGRRGTENFTGGHVAGGLFVPIKSAALQQHVLPLAALDATRYWKFLERGMRPGEAPLISRTVEARALRPYAPVQHAASGGPFGSADITLSWERRARLLGELRDGTGTVPLAEDSEAYELEIIGPDGEVIRTVSGLASRSYVYEVPDQDTDFDPYDFALINPSFETGDLTGWTIESGNATASDGIGALSSGRTGGFFLYSGDSFVAAQTVDVSRWVRSIDAGGITATARVWIAEPESSPNEARVTMQFLDGASAELGVQEPAYTDPSGASWAEIQASATLPVGTRRIKIRVQGNEISGPGLDIAFDDASLELAGSILEVEFAVYQVSAQVGRGFAGTATVEIEA